MDFATLLVAAYLVIAIVATALTIRERIRERKRGIDTAVLGLVACLLWPVTAAIMIIVMWVHGRGEARH